MNIVPQQPMPAKDMIKEIERLFDNTLRAIKKPTFLERLFGKDEDTSSRA